uniref:Cathepsin propeptide inhibitor domain-containing protein n=1 Tax=Salix viminalis TaxID=40686 RepID=A0A6N2KFL8_SALVM
MENYLCMQKPAKPQLTLFIFLLLAPLPCLSSGGLPGEYSVVSTDIHEGLSEEGLVEVFKLWKEKHQKVYRDAEEAEKRIGNFKRNLKYVIEKNGKRKSRFGADGGTDQVRRFEQ